MSISAISNGFSGLSSQTPQNPILKLQKEFQQLGQDLQAGNLTAAQSDTVTLQQYLPKGAVASSSQSNSPIAQAFSQLMKDIQAGNLSAAQQDYSTIEQDLQSRAAQGSQDVQGSQATQGTQATSGNQHHGGGAAGEVGRFVSQLGQDLQASALSSARQAYSSIQQEFQNFAAGNGEQAGTSSLLSPGGISVRA